MDREVSESGCLSGHDSLLDQGPSFPLIDTLADLSCPLPSSSESRQKRSRKFPFRRLPPIIRTRIFFTIGSSSMPWVLHSFRAEWNFDIVRGPPDRYPCLLIVITNHVRVENPDGLRSTRFLRSFDIFRIEFKKRERLLDRKYD